jgi:hypothetical protein
VVGKGKRWIFARIGLNQAWGSGFFSLKKGVLSQF